MPTKKTNLKKVAIGAAVAGLAGYVAGLLTAPKSGKKSRQQLSLKSEKELEIAKEKLTSLHNEISELISSAKGDENSPSEKGLNKFSDALTAAKAAKDKLATALDAVKNGQSNDTDLNKAVKEAEKAIKHAKDFLLKK